MKRRQHPTRKTAVLLKQCEKFCGIYARRSVKPGTFGVPGVVSYTCSRRTQ